MSGFLARGFSAWRDLPLVGWFLVAIGVALTHRWIPDADWLMVHVVLLGAVTHAIMVWSHHFAQTMLKLPDSDTDRRAQILRLALLAGGTALVLVGVPTTWWPVTAVGATVVSVAVGWHGTVLVQMLRRALPARFRVSVRYYIAAAACLLIGIGFGATLAWGWQDPWHGRLLVAHALTNLLGWVGLTVAGTLLTLWPTMLRTRMDADAERWTRGALPVLLAGVVVASGGALVGVSWLAALGIVGYLAGFGLWARGLWEPARNKPPTEFAPASVAAALAWLVIGLGWAGWLLVTAPDWETVRTGFGGPAAALAAGFGVQVVTGALSYLLPSVSGGGPAAVRAGQVWFNRAGGFRLVAINGGLLLWFLPSPSWVKVTGSLLALLAAASFLPLMAGGLVAGHRVRTGRTARDEPAAATGLGAGDGSASRDAEPSTGPIPRVGRPPAGSIWSAGQVIAGLTAVVTAVVVGVGVDPGAAGVGTAPTSSVQPTGTVVRVEVTVSGMRYQPSSVQLSAGDRLVIDLVNTGDTTHDLVIADARTPRLAPGERAELDVGVVGASIQGYCSVVGHRQMGMVFDVIVDDAPAAEPNGDPEPGHDHGGGAPPSGTEVPPLSAVIDPVLPPLDDRRVQRLTLTVQEVNLEVAPGVWQRRWTFGGTAPGPTLHGRVGDVFEITLVNDGSIGHSIDFHAGSLAPDRPMRTIEPGESLVYRFTATMAGVWMYHCSTMPMSAHIAAGMHGAVVIEPDDLPEVDRSYVLVQSEVYLDTAAGQATDATEVNADAVSAEEPDYVVFNGVANAYDQQPLTAKVGERIRFWVLDAGPNRPSSFHIVGAQFDTVYAEGGYLLRHGRDAFGTGQGGSQVLGLLPAQGGFVEAVFPEPGRYPVVSHLMVDAERGAHGFVEVSD